MIIDRKDADRYFVLLQNEVLNGWDTGWTIFNRNGSPVVKLDVKEIEISKPQNHSNNLNSDLWPDTKDYDQNNPGIIERVFFDLNQRVYQSDIEKAFWVNVTRVPICVSYLAACAKVRPMTILELGTGGDSAHSTGMFIYWLSQGCFGSPCLVSVDRHPLSHAWLRYRDYSFWNFIQGDSIHVMRKLINNRIGNFPKWWDMIFIDSSHTYPHTLKEIEQASFMTHAILLDDTTVPEVKQSLEEFLKKHNEWLRIDLAHGVTLIERHDHISKT